MTCLRLRLSSELSLTVLFIQALLAIVLVLALAAEARAAAGAEFGSAVVACDFNGDGFNDLAVGAPGEDVGAEAAAGAVHVLYGTPGGLGDIEQSWDQNTANVQGSAEAGDGFGTALTAGDFDADGSCDLAIGVPGKHIGQAADAGAVVILYGGPAGLSATNAQFWSQDSPGIEGTAEAGDNFGSALAVGDFNGDGFADLAIGIPGEDVGPIVDAGAVNVLYGAPQGLTALGNQVWDQNRQFVEGAAEEGDHFGAALAAGDFDLDGFADLAIGVPDEDVGPVVDAGSVNVLYGTRGGLSAFGDQIWDQSKLGVLGGPETGDQFGSALASGDFNGDGFADLAIGVPGEDIGTVANAGAVNVLYGGPGSLSADGDRVDRFWDQNKTGIEGTATTDDRFGSVLATGDFNSDGFADLAVGVPGDKIGTIAGAGAVNVLYGTPDKLSASGDQLWSQNTLGAEDAAETGDHFGSSLATGDFNGDGFADLAVGIPNEEVAGDDDAGAVQTFNGNPGKLTAAGNRLSAKKDLKEGKPPEALPTITEAQLTDPKQFAEYLSKNKDAIRTGARFLKALPPEFKQNSIMMTGTESAQCGDAKKPRIILQSLDAKKLFGLVLGDKKEDCDSVNASSRDPFIVEYIRWDPTQKKNSFRFFEINLATGTIGEDETDVKGKCSKCHTGRPNWDAYDSWGGMLPFNRDRLYEKTVETKAVARILGPPPDGLGPGPKGEPAGDPIVTQLALPPGIVRNFDSGKIEFDFDKRFDAGKGNVRMDPGVDAVNVHAKAEKGKDILYDPKFDNISVPRGGKFLLFDHTRKQGLCVYGGKLGRGCTDIGKSGADGGQCGFTAARVPGRCFKSDEGRGVALFDNLTALNRLRVAQEIINQKDKGIDVRRVAVAIAKNCIKRDNWRTFVSDAVQKALLKWHEDKSQAEVNDGNSTVVVKNLTDPTKDDDLIKDTDTRRHCLPKLKAQVQFNNLTGKVGLGATAEQAVQDIFHRSFRTAVEEVNKNGFGIDLTGNYDPDTLTNPPPSNTPPGFMVDREIYGGQNERIALFRLFLEPSHVRVYKWSMSVLRRSGTYTFGDLFDQYLNGIITDIGELSDIKGTIECGNDTERTKLRTAIKNDFDKVKPDFFKFQPDTGMRDSDILSSKSVLNLKACQSP
jgi:hypothetical protein